jgi:hypothetical protein
VHGLERRGRWTRRLPLNLKVVMLVVVERLYVREALDTPMPIPGEEADRK